MFPLRYITKKKLGIFFVVAKGLRAQRAGRVAPRRGGAERRAAALGAAQRRKAPPQAAERRTAHKACFYAFNFAPIIENQKMLTGRSAGIRPVLWPGQLLGIKLHGQRMNMALAGMAKDERQASGCDFWKGVNWGKS